ncbi:multiheme c-type cytochrome [Mucilaginibacter flavus]|uniref:multiheme c-type cytochrome n=1 Tax=Mucilaginibacter flavus TaxID=931504 RepID=UPI0025B2CE0D|nr:multiheme c-type cytochrome [Mucilaginibacter flavus]MDN3580113.1 multiheme c-type cytochrome [Mucilaginibacter flavus]
MKKVLAIAGICIALLAILYVQLKPGTASADPRGNAYAGSKACARCHAKIADSYLHTAHFMASMPATAGTVHGSFAAGKNTFSIDQNQKIVMEKRGGGLYQTYYVDGKAKDAHRFDVVFGGVKGESYLYWKDDRLYQLPLSYFNRQDEWSTSPGYKFSFVDFRSIGKRCLECHVSYVNEMPGEKQQLSRDEQFDKSTMVYGIDCERCHGPGAQHVDFQTNNPQVKTAKFIARYASLSRAQRMDACAVCHSGIHTSLLKSTFGFMPGDTFAKYKLPEFQQHLDTTQLDVHGKQFQLLQSSKCYLNSKMDCGTCHDTHQNTRGNDVLYAQKCLSCHNNAGHTYCKMSNKLGADVLKSKCISCHMPELTTNVISVQVADKAPPVRFFVHTHHIAIYPQEVKKILAFINK